MSKLLEIKILEDQIKYHKNLYYNHQPEISDAEFDALVDELAALDPDNSTIRSVGAPVEEDGWKKAKHQIPMGSLNKASNKEEINVWIDKYVKNDVFIIEKVDGLSIECLYEDGKLISAITRGDGIIGDEIFDNVSKMRGVKTNLPLLFTGSLRGEIILTKSNHKEYFSDKSNVRNTAAGVSRRLDGQGCEHLEILFYQAIGNVELHTEVEQLEYIQQNLQLKVPGWYVGNNAKNLVDEIYDKYQKELRQNLDYDIDGLVVKVNNLQEQQDYGERDSRPKGAIAYKFPVEKSETTVKNILIQVGNSGRITPVAEVEPVLLAGAMISRATLHNFKRVQDLGINTGAVVLLTRRGDIIPAVEAVLKPTGHSYLIPTECPACGGPVELQGENLMCSSTDVCPAQIKGRVANWINTIGVLEWGDKILEKLVENKLINSIPDIYRLSVSQLMGIERMGEKSAKKCHSILWSHNELPLEIFLGGLSIPMAAVSTIKMLMESGYDSLEKILSASEEDLINVKGIGRAKAKSLKDGIKRNQNIIKDLLETGIKIKEPKKGNLTGKKICITGSTKIKRSALQNLIAENGGIYKSSISKDCTHLVISDPNSTSIKAVSARSMGIQLISEEDLLGMIK